MAGFIATPDAFVSLDGFLTARSAPAVIMETSAKIASATLTAAARVPRGAANAASLCACEDEVRLTPGELDASLDALEAK
ncbi:MAG: hypothetical protein WBA29_00595 [Xanthobacteraceae bacterium]